MFQHKISDYIGVTTPQKGYTSQQREIFSINPLPMMEANILEDGHLKADHLLYAARAKLDNLGAIKSHSEIVNDPKRIQRMIERLQVHEMEGDVQLALKKEKERLAAKEVESLRPVLKDAIKLYVSGNHGRRLEKKMIKAILHFAFGETPHRSNAKKEEMLDQLKLLEQKDTENRTQQSLGKPSVCDSSVSESVNQDSNEEPLYDVVAEERGTQMVENEQKESSGESTLNEIAIIPKL